MPVAFPPPQQLLSLSAHDFPPPHPPFLFLVHCCSETHFTSHSCCLLSSLVWHEESVSCCCSSWLLQHAFSLFATHCFCPSHLLSWVAGSSSHNVWSSICGGVNSNTSRIKNSFKSNQKSSCPPSPPPQDSQTLLPRI